MGRLTRVFVVFAVLATLFAVSSPAYANHKPGHTVPPGNACGHTYPPPEGCPPNAGPDATVLDLDLASATEDTGAPMGLVLGAGGLGVAGLMVIHRRRAKKFLR